LQVLEALLLALLKDTASSLYRQPISMFIREILVGGGGAGCFKSELSFCGRNKIVGSGICCRAG
jgi:hypothetical protein